MNWIEGFVDGSKKFVPLASDPVTIGRSKDCDFSFPEDKQVSRFHAMIELRERGWYVVDQKSTNGSYVNEQRVTVPFPIKVGDVVRVGEQRLRVRDEIELPAPENFVSAYPGYPHYYILLKVPRTASRDEIDLAYVELKKIFDPALHPGIERIHTCAKEVEEAYAVLADPARRVLYDASLPPEAAETS
jgi:hypothetical protein